jgi:selenocysteine lyase/cysteine desulfurase
LILPNQRALFDIPDHVTYLNCAYMSPLMMTVTEAGKRGVLRKTSPWNIGVPDFFVESDSLRATFAQLIGCTGDDVAIIPAVSYGVSAAARNLPIEKGQSILVAAEQFPSNVYPWLERAKEVGATIKTAPRPSNGDWTSSVLETFDSSVAVVALPPCHWADGGLFDLKTIGAHCRKQGVYLVVDASQSLGVMPVSIEDIQPDFLVVPTYKWLLGPYSLGFLYVSKRWQEGSPIEHSWSHRRNAEDFSGLGNYEEQFAAGARRFDVGERANFALSPMAETALRQILDWGVENIAETVGSITHRLTEKAQSLGIESTPSERRAGHYLGLKLPADAPQDLPSRLAEEDIYVSRRGSSLRVTPYLYNTDQDLDRFLAVLKKSLP